MKRPLAFLLPIVLLWGCRSVDSVEGSTAPEFLVPADSAAQSLPFSEAVRVDNVLYLSGQIGLAPGTLELVPGGIEAEAAQTLDNIRSVLERHGSSLDEVFKCTVFLADIAEWPAFNEVYREYFSSPYPARSALAASGLALGASVEVECLAYAPDAERP
jgi:2-iminobutanoate/2-iminopropanoate deaminase